VDQVAKMEALPELFPLVLVVVSVAGEESALVVELVAQHLEMELALVLVHQSV